MPRTTMRPAGFRRAALALVAVILAALGGLATSRPAHAASDFSLLVLPDQGESAIYSFVSSATSSIDVTIYELKDTTLENDLVSREKAGVDVAGEWVADLTFVSGSSRHHFTIAQQDGQLSGTHRGDVLSGKLTGAVEGRRVTIRSSQRIEGAMLHYEFSGDSAGDRMEGVVKLGEYGQARWLAQKLAQKA